MTENLIFLYQFCYNQEEKNILFLKNEVRIEPSRTIGRNMFSSVNHYIL